MIKLLEDEIAILETEHAEIIDRLKTTAVREIEMTVKLSQQHLPFTDIENAHAIRALNAVRNHYCNVLASTIEFLKARR